MNTIRNTVAVLLVAGLVAAPMAASNPIPTLAQQLVCGSTGMRELINNGSGWETGTCESMEEYWHPLFTRDECAVCSEEALVHEEDATLVGGQPIPPIPPEDVPGQGVEEGLVDEPVGTLEGVKEPSHPAGPRYCLYWTPEGGSRTLLQCIDPTFLLYDQMPEFEKDLLYEPAEDIPLTPPIDEGEVLGGGGESPRTSYDLHVGYRWYEDLLHMQVGPGLVQAWAPVDVSEDEEVDWWLDNAPKTSLDIEFTLHVEGQESRGLALHWPLIGQVLAANQRTVDDLPV